MPTEKAATNPVMHTVAARRILRLAFGTAAALWFSQAVAWDLSFIMPALASFLLAVPIPAPSLKKGLAFVLALTLPVSAALLLLPFLYDYRAAGVLILLAACFWSFYYSAKGGSPVLGAFLAIGLAVLTTVGSVSIDAALMVNKAAFFNAVIAMMFVWLAHAFFPDPPPPENRAPRPAPPAPSREMAVWSAWRSTVIVFPVMLFFLVYSESAAYLVVMIKVASMGQQVENDSTRAVGRSLLLSTVIGGIGAVIIWEVLSIWPSLLMYTLMVALGGLIMGRRIFQGLAMHPRAGTWSYAFLTMLVIIAPAVMDSAGGGTADAKFWDRLLMMFAATFYSVAAVTVYDAFRPREKSIAGTESSA